MAVVVGAATDLGRVRTNNEDCFAVFLPPALPAGLEAVLLVADGMGGHQAGEVASGLVASRFACWFGDGGPQQLDRQLDLGALLARIIQEANLEVYEQSQADPQRRGMGTTVVAAAITAGRLDLASVGDSRAYLIDETGAYQLNHDHSWVAEEVRAGRLTLAEARVHPRRNVLTRAVGVAATVEVETRTFELGKGDQLLLCTDGLTNLVSDSELFQIVRESAEPRQAVAQLIQLANRRGAPDNVTAVLACYRTTATPALRDRATETIPTGALSRPD